MKEKQIVTLQLDSGRIHYLTRVGKRRKIKSRSRLIRDGIDREIRAHFPNARLDP